MKNFRKLKVWERGYTLALSVYKCTAGFPVSERFGLSSQLRRAATSVPAKIAEGCGRAGNAEFGRFLQIAMGSLSELECHLMLARDLGYLTQEHYIILASDVVELGRMLNSLIAKVSAGRRGH